MSSRTTLRPYAVINAVSMAANITGTATILQSITGVSFAFKWAGTSPVGTVSIQASNDYALEPDGSVANAGTWTTLSLEYNGAVVTTVPVSGNSGNGIVELQKINTYAVRPIYTFTSGVGTLTCIINGKVS